MQRVKSPLSLQNPTVKFKAKMYLSLVSFQRIIICLCLLLMSWRCIKLYDIERCFNLTVLLICIHKGHTFKCINAVQHNTTINYDHNVRS